MKSFFVMLTLPVVTPVVKLSTRLLAKIWVPAVAGMTTVGLHNVKTHYADSVV
ncbi:hypothetical protein [Budvicia diplopodorum]|uniref:hypothetical protein n=1 Tax=Budvicia diplopodorum TaxID=1119056 RepID=UPI0013585024|nr:hypothetical protein [Budvicia diplopodorum]